MARPTSHSKCSAETAVVMHGELVTVSCERSDGHTGAHRGGVTWPPRGAEPGPKG